MKRIHHTTGAGFTLIELLVVTGILLLLSTTAIATAGTARAKTRNTRRVVESRAILDAVLNYQLDHAEALPEGIDAMPRMIGTATSGCSITCNTADTNIHEVTLPPTADAYIFQWQPRANYGSDPLLHIHPWGRGLYQRSLIRFDLSSLPEDVLVLSAQLWLREDVNRGFDRTTAAHRVTRDWTERGVSWLRYNSLTPWTTPGGDFDPNPTDTALLNWNGNLEWNSWDVTTDVQGFVNGAYNHYGWLLKDTREDSSQDFWFFSSREGSAAPYLEVQYTDIDSGPSNEVCLDLSDDFMPNYLNRVPVDPLLGTAERTFYTIRQTPNGELVVRSCGAELGETITARGS